MWNLSAAGREQAASLATEGFWARVEALHSSDEPKALQTGAPAAAMHGLNMAGHAGLREVERPAGRVGDYAAAVRAYLKGKSGIPGWESRDAASLRIGEAIRTLLDSGARVTAVISHGLVITLYMTALLGLSSAYDLWTQIPFAGHARIDPDTARLLQPFTSPAVRPRPD
nr:histidine phosphatase family protein [Gemmatimonadota bacterium]